MLERIKVCFTESIQTQIAAAEALPDAISRAAMTLVQSLLNGNKILCCGNGTSAANAQHFAASMINRFETERPSLPAIALNTDNVVLTAIANDRLHDEIYAKQVRAPVMPEMCCWLSPRAAIAGILSKLLKPPSPAT